jgi:hypothetical protein
MFRNGWWIETPTRWRFGSQIQFAGVQNAYLEEFRRLPCEMKVGNPPRYSVACNPSLICELPASHKEARNGS